MKTKYYSGEIILYLNHILIVTEDKEIKDTAGVTKRMINAIPIDGTNNIFGITGEYDSIEIPEDCVNYLHNEYHDDECEICAGTNIQYWTKHGIHSIKYLAPNIKAFILKKLDPFSI